MKIFKQYLIATILIIAGYGISFAQSPNNFVDAVGNMGIDTKLFSEKETVSRYELARLLNAVECQDCIHPANQMIDIYTNPFRTTFTQSPGKDFDDIGFQGGLYQGESQYYCVAYVGDNNYMRGYPEGISPICSGLFCGARNTNQAEFIQVIINILAKYIYQDYHTNRKTIKQRKDALIPNSYADRYLDANDKKIINDAATECTNDTCTIKSDSALKTYIKYCMFNLKSCDMIPFGSIGQAYWPVAELNILYKQSIIDAQSAIKTDIYNNIDGKTIIDILGKLYSNIQCSFNTDYDCDGRDNKDDNCPNDYNPSQNDMNNDGVGDVCDEDIDGDGKKNEKGIVDETTQINITALKNTEDNCPLIKNNDQADSNKNHIGDVCEKNDGGVSLAIQIEKIGQQSPLTIRVSAIVKGDIVGDIERDMNDGNQEKGAKITHTYTNPGVYVITAKAKGQGNQAIAKATMIVGEGLTQYRGIQAKTNKRRSNTSTDITFSAQTVGDVEYIQWDFGNNVRINKNPDESFTRQYNASGTYAVVARAFKGNTIQAISRITIGIGSGYYGSQLISKDSILLETAQKIHFFAQGGSITSSDIRQITWDFGDGTKTIENTMATTHIYTQKGPKVVIQTILLQDNTQITNYMTLFIVDPLYNQVFGKSLMPSEGKPILGQVLKYSTTFVGDTITDETTTIQRYTNTASQRYQEKNTVLRYRYDSAGVYYPTNITYINQCLFLESQATIVVQQQNSCTDIVRTGRTKQYCDMDHDNIPDICDDDIDNDGTKNLIGLVMFDNPDCRIDNKNINQELLKQHTKGVCTLDNCPGQKNPKQEDLDHSGIGDVCEQDTNTLLKSSNQEQPQDTTISHDSDGDGITDTSDTCPTLPENYNGIADEDGCPEIGTELACPYNNIMPKIPSEIGGNINNNAGNNTTLGNAPKCSINTTLCADNTCQAICTKNGGNPLSNNNNSCEAGESCTSTDCAGQQSRCQNGLLCSMTTKICITNTGTAIPTNIPTQVGETPGGTPNCTDPTLCIQIPSIIPTTCNQCPCQFADFASDLMMGDTFKAGLRDASHTIFYTYSSPYTLE